MINLKQPFVMLIRFLFTMYQVLSENTEIRHILEEIYILQNYEEP